MDEKNIPYVGSEEESEAPHHSAGESPVSDHIERPVHQIVDKISDSLDRLEKQLELLGKIINREPGNQEEVDEPPR